MMDTVQPTLPRRRFFSDMPDRGLFGLVAIGGFFAIMLLKVNGINAELIAVMAVALMVAYGIVAFQMPLVGMRPDRLGDNFYYLGFIFTLASLSAALMQLRAEVNVSQLLGSFGIALVTTIVGIAGRVLFVQLRSDLDDVEESVRRDLAATSAELRAQLGQSVREFETFRTTLLQVLAESKDEWAKAQSLQVEKIEALATSAASRIEAAFEGHRGRAEDLTSALETITKSSKTASQRLASMRLPTEEFDSELRAFAERLEQLLLRLGQIVEEVAKRSLSSRSWLSRLKW